MNRKFVVVSSLLLIALAAIIITPGIGLQTITLKALFANEQARFVFFSIRLPRMLTAFFAGGGLAVCGMIYQALFKNPLADPFTLGISSGSSLGAALCIVSGISGAISGVPTITIAAFTGAFIVMALIYLFALDGKSDSGTILLAGVVVTTVCSGAIMFIHVVGGVHKSYQILRWLMGAVDGVSIAPALMMIIPVVVLLFGSWVMMPLLDQLTTGDTIAHSRGVNIKRTRLQFIVLTTLVIAFIVSICGPIGFVGIIAPHACRMAVPGIRHRLLAICSFLLGGTFLTIADTVARSLAPPSEIPVGIITSLCGGPFFLLILYKMKRKILL